MIRRLSDTPIWIRLTGAIWLMLVVTWTGMILWETRTNRETTLEQAKDFAITLNEMTMAGLTGMMITGTVSQRDVFLDQIKELSAVHELRVLRGEAVSKLFGPGAPGAMEMDAEERAAMQTGKPLMRVEMHPRYGEHLRVVMPSLAAHNYLGKDCISCHQVEPGTPLGAVSMRVSLDKVNQAVDNFRNKSLLAALVLSLPLLGFVYLFIRRFVVSPLTEMTHSLAEIARGKGDLTRRLEVRGDDEIGRTAKVVNEMMATIAGLVRQVDGSARAVTQSARSLSDTAERVAASSHRQNDQSLSAAGAVEQMTANIAHIAQSTEAVRERSNQSLQRSREGQESLGRLIAEVGQIEGAVGNMAELVSAFVQSTVSITRMTQEVREIAEQTNLLALNAAIEAARAGEQGRGFAVVAGEVGALARRSATAAQEIKKLIHDSVEKVTTGAAVVESAGGTMTDIVTHAQRMNGLLSDIATAAREQSAGVAQVGQAVQELDRVTQENAALVEETAAASMALKRQAEALAAAVESFRLS